MKLKFVLIASVLLVSACASHVGQSLQEKNQAFRDYLARNNIENIEKVTSFRFHGWSSLTDDFLIISSSPKKKYLVELIGYCADIRWAQTIIVNRTTSSMLHARIDSVSAIESPQVKCRISSIYPLTKEQLQDIRNINKSEKAEQE